MSDLFFFLSAGPTIAFEAFSVVDSWGQPRASLHASQALVGNIAAALNQARPIARGKKDASEQQLGSALQTAFAEALPKVSRRGSAHCMLTMMRMTTLQRDNPCETWHSFAKPCKRPTGIAWPS